MAREESSVPPCWSEVDTRVSVGVPMVSLGGVFVPCEGRERADIRTDGAEGKDRKPADLPTRCRISYHCHPHSHPLQLSPAQGSEAR